MEGRNDFIVDNDDNEDNDCEQVDMVSILVNLAFVNKDVATSFQFAPGYSKSFINAVNDSNEKKIN